MARRNTLRIGLIAGFVGVGVGLVLGLIAGFFGGLAGLVIRIISDSLLTVPGIAILVIIAANVGQMTIEIMAPDRGGARLDVPDAARSARRCCRSASARTWRSPGPTATVELGILFREIMPNLLPFIAASFVGAVSGAMLAAIGLEALGLGANDVHTLGTTIYWAQKYSAVLRGQWWWWGPPIVDDRVHLPRPVPDLGRARPLRQPPAASSMT